MSQKNQIESIEDIGAATCANHGTHPNWRQTKNRNGVIISVLCRPCETERRKRHELKNPRSERASEWGYNGTVVKLLLSTKRRSKEKGLSFEITRDWLEERIKIQNNKCAYSGYLFDYSKPKLKGKIRLFAPSLDQKIPGAGYTKENTVVCCAIVNMMKNELSVNEFLDICKRISETNK